MLKDNFTIANSPIEPTQAAAEFGTWPYFGAEEIEASARVLRSGKVNYWTGEEGRLFETEYAAYTQCRHAVAVASGTAALELALRALGIGPGDEVITSSRTFIASASCAVAVGARPVFADVNRESQNVTVETLRAVLSPATKAIIAVHLAGWPCEMDAILAFAREHGLKVIEDCAQAHGATYRNKPVGSFGDVAAFSFCQDKIMTTAGEGGMVTTDSSDLWQRMWSYKDHGKSYESTFHKQHPWGFRWLHESFGTNWRLSEVQSAVGRVALRKLPEWLQTRRRHAAHMIGRLSCVSGLRIAEPAGHIRHSYYKFYAFVEAGELARGWNRDRVAQAIAAEGVPCSTGSCSEIYLEAAFPPRWRPRKRLAIARELGECSLMFPVHPTLTDANVERVCDAVEKVMSMAARKRFVSGTDSSIETILPPA